jgi:hypothetical protein
MDTTAPLPPAQPPVQKSGGGAGKWVLFGCGGCLALIALAALAGVGIFMFIFGALKSSDVYQLSLKRAQETPQVQAALGTPIEPGFMMSGSVDVGTSGGTADFNFPVSGPKGAGTVTAKATKPAGGDWIYSILQVKIDASGEVIDLLGTVPHQ